MRIGLMGGTFNPIHLAHLRIAEEAKEACGLDRVLFIPAADPPHKPLAGEVPFSRRCEMVSLAIADNPAFELSDIEGLRNGKSYSIDTIAHFRREHPDDLLFFIIGGDSFLEIGQWHRFAEIFRSCSLIVVERPQCLVPEPLAAVPAGIKGEFSYEAESHKLLHQSGEQVHFLRGCLLDISSSEIRRLASTGRSITYLVPSVVDQYIKEQRIYT
ncbi:MAG: nicotinate-nucleotide adenylyltransferase [Deltaproteobacteria bacterium]